ncbi:MAG: HlyC/CorC family transporter [Chloroflexota bacterium]|nr:MAG: HlyC/CorC family transporter [Chloroflexota bacterium]
MTEIVFEVTFILILILLNGLLAMSEIAVVSSRKVRLQQRASEGDERARSALRLAEAPSDFLSTVQIGITLVGVFAGALGGATIATALSGWLQQFASLAPFARTVSVTLVVITITYLSLIFGELAPKRIALNSPERVAMALAPLMVRLSKLTAPVVRFLSASTNLVLRLLGIRPSDDPLVTEEDVRVMIQQGTQAGVFEEAEQEMVAGVFRLGDLRAGTLITPRTEITWLDVEDPPEVNQRKIIETKFSYFPVAKGSLDEVQGVVLAKDLLVACLTGQPVDISSNIHPPTFVPENMPALKMLELLRDVSAPIAFVIDEFGGVQGMVTVNDILEAIVGDITIRGETYEPDIIRREDGSYLLDGLVTTDELLDLLDLGSLPGFDSEYETLGGFVMTFLGRIPSAGDHFEWGGFKFEVVDMDGLRVDKVLVMPLDSPVEGDIEIGAQD